MQRNQHNLMHELNLNQIHLIQINIKENDFVENFTLEFNSI